MQLEIIRTLYAYNDWANRKLMAAATLVSAIDYKRDLGFAWGSIHNTFTHLLSTDMLWLSRWQGHSPLAMPDVSGVSSLGLLRSRWEAVMTERQSFIASLTPERLAESLNYRDTKGDQHVQPLWLLLLHVANHGTDHRSHISLMMTQLGYQPPPLDFIVYVRDMPLSNQMKMLPNEDSSFI